MRFCPNCGIPVGESPRYCAGCGTQVTPVPFGSSPAGSAPAERGPFDSAPLRLGSTGTPPLGAVSVAESPPSERAAAAPAPGMAESWLPAELSATSRSRAIPPPPSWLDPLSPVSHPQADGLPGAAPAPARRAAPGNRRRPVWSGHRMTITAMVATLALVGAAGVATWRVSQLHGQPRAAVTSLQPPRAGLAAGTGHRGSTQPAAHGSAAPLPRPARSAAPSATHRPAPPAPVGNAVVAVGPQALHGPQVRQVVALLTTYFESINDQNFAEYQSLFVPSIQRMMTHFGSGYAGTFDSGATLAQLVATGPHGLAATVAFISHQNPASSPDGASCDSWLITLFLKVHGNTLHIRHPRPGFPQSVLACS